MVRLLWHRKTEYERHVAIIIFQAYLFKLYPCLFSEQNKDGVLWSSALPDDMDWSSVVTVTQNHIIGSASKVTPSDSGLPGFKLPIDTLDRVVVLDRFTGELIWYHTLPDDCAATVTVGPDGSLYVPMLGIFSILAIEERPTLGLIRFIPDLNTPRLK